MEWVVKSRRGRRRECKMEGEGDRYIGRLGIYSERIYDRKLEGEGEIQ